ncbi:hypothetical protein BpHYR1_012758 [Brachionus plicatilis]|uniref:Uncharacterized protein n=1 Tax=Brachionus plicatilis TaxID=10195 RepID=A0A3M7STP8_BRAPC|nr:hypothetical protein BpHYR1_012758 [Brachionus plicatilis]
MRSFLSFDLKEAFWKKFCNLTQLIFHSLVIKFFFLTPESDSIKKSQTRMTSFKKNQERAMQIRKKYLSVCVEACQKEKNINSYIFNYAVVLVKLKRSVPIRFHSVPSIQIIPLLGTERFTLARNNVANYNDFFKYFCYGMKNAFYKIRSENEYLIYKAPNGHETIS